MVLAQDLRDAVLQAALQGKLTKQLETDSSVDELLIKIKENRINIDKKNLLVEKEDELFEIPKTWKWVRLGTIADIKGGKRVPVGKSLVDNNTGHKYIRVADMQNGTINIDSIKYITDDIYEMIKNYYIKKEDIYITVAGTIGKVGIVPPELDGANLTENADKIIFSNLNKQWFLITLSSNALQVQIRNLTKKVGQPKLALKRIKELLLPLPPVEEQQRIVDRVNELMKKIDEYEKVEKELLALEQKFPDDMKNALLQAAMQGKLTEHLDSDSSVDELIDKCCKDKKKAIEEGKYRKERYRGAIENSEFLPCKIPENWRWVYISDMALFQEGPGILAKDFRDSGVPLIRIAGMRSDKVSLEGCNYLDENMVKDKWNHFKLDLGDIVISTSASMDKIAEVQKDTVNAILYTGLIRFKMYGNINKEYFKYFIKSPFYLHQIDEQKAGGTIKHYGPSHLKKMIIPLPPIEEQQRIVEQLEKLLPLCETL